MESTGLRWIRPVALAVAIGWIGADDGLSQGALYHPPPGGAAVELPPLPGGSPAKPRFGTRGRRMFGLGGRDSAVKRTQAEPTPAPPVPVPNPDATPGQPTSNAAGEAVNSTAPTATGDTTGPTTGGDTPNPTAAGEEPGTPDLSVPASQRDTGGGEPTTAEADEEKAEPEPTLLSKALGREDSPVKIYGWLQNSYTGNTNGKPPSGENFGVFPNHRANEWQGNQYYLIVENPLEQNDEVNFGFRADNLYGNDWQFSKSYGFADNAFKLNSFSGYDLPQIYGEVHLPILTEGGIDLKGGRFYTLAGYEQVPAINRPLLSVPYMFNYGQPFTHVGAITTLHLTDRINLYNGAINGWDRWINQRYKWGYIGGFSWTSKSGDTSLAFTTVWGPNQLPNFPPTRTQIYPTGTPIPPREFAGRRNFGYGDSDRVLFTTVLTHKWNKKLTQIVETDQAQEQNVPFLDRGRRSQSAEWYSIGNWFLYQFDDKLTGVWRSEVFRDDDGARTGVADTFYEVTLGLIYKPKNYLWVRPEARYDWAQFKEPYNDGTRGSQFTLAVDVIFLF